MRSSLVVALVLLAVSVSDHSTWATPCPRYGGTLCNVPGDVSQVASTFHPTYSEADNLPASYVFVWADDRDATSTGSDIYFNEFISCLDSTAQSGTPLCTEVGDQVAPVAAFTGLLPLHLGYPSNAGVIVGWEDHRGPDSDIYARRVDGWSPHAPWDTSPIPICDAIGDQTQPVLVPSINGRGIFGWLDSRSGTPAVYAQRVDSAGIGAWGSNGIPVCSAAGGRENLHAVADGAGGAYFLWLDHRSADAIYAMRLTSDGAPALGWSTDGNLVASGVQVAGELRNARDASGVAVAWTDTRDDPGGDVYMQRILPDGTTPAGWPGSGLAVTTGPDAQRMDDLVHDNFVVWESEAPGSGGNSDLYASRLTNNGAVMAGWPAAVCTNPARQEHARMTLLGNVLCVAFADDRNADRDLYASGLNAGDGTLASGWTADGTIVSGAADVQDDPVLEPGRIAWIDYRDRGTNDADLYGASLTSTGRVGVPTTAAPSRVVLSAPRPNPAVHDAWFALETGGGERADVDVYDCAGRRVKSVTHETLSAGRHELHWDGSTEGGAAAKPGVYFIRARVGEASLQRPIVLRP